MPAVWWLTLNTHCNVPASLLGELGEERHCFCAWARWLPATVGKEG